MGYPFIYCLPPPLFTNYPQQTRQFSNNKSVSWIRVRDDHILTVDRMTFIADDRYQAIYVDSSGMWTLQIKYVQARDAGIYECQVATTEPTVSARAHLHVVGESECRMQLGVYGINYK